MKCKALTKKQTRCRHDAVRDGYCQMHAQGATRVGKKPGLTPDVAKKIEDAVRAGAYLRQAAEHVGIREQTLHAWRARGRDPNEKDPRYAEFHEALTRASASAEVGAVAVIRGAMLQDWRAAVAFLKMRFPERWSERTQVDVTQRSEIDEEIRMLLAEMDSRDTARNGNGRATA